MREHDAEAAAAVTSEDTARVRIEGRAGVRVRGVAGASWPHGWVEVGVGGRAVANRKPVRDRPLVASANYR